MITMPSDAVASACRLALAQNAQHEEPIENPTARPSGYAAIGS